MTLRTLVLLVLVSVPAAARAEDVFPRTEVHAELLNAVLFRSDSDFDRSPPRYAENGQTVGFVGTLFRPRIDLHVWRSLRLHYDAEIGFNAWSLNDPDVQAALAPAALVFRHRQLYAEGELLEDRFGFKVGYSRLIDSTGLFVNAWLGNAQASWVPSAGRRYTLFAGQLPDGTFEGLEVEQNNLLRDITLLGVRGAFELGSLTRLEASLEAVIDTHVVHQRRLIVDPGARIDRQLGPVAGSLGVALQVGRLEGQARDGSDRLLLAWALQAHGAMPAGPLALTFNAMALSADSSADGSPRSGTFLYSGRSTSATVLLTEDEVLDWRDSVDRRMSMRQGGFWENRAGLAVADVKAVWASERLSPGLILGAATTLNPANALGQVLVGVEADALVEARVTNHLVAQVLTGMLVPGGAGSALINRIEPTGAVPILTVEASLRVTY